MANGIIVIDKPQDWTSHDVVAKVRGILRERRVGHAGTLDPMATGVLPVFVGRATRAVEFAAESRKEYVAGLRLGVVTDTQDSTGTVLDRRPAAAGRADMEAALAGFRGEILQIPPMYSALKRDGKKLYELARQGKEVEREPRPITIYALELLEQTGEEEYLLRVECSKGTYVRTLCHDLGAALGCGGCMCSLRRTRAAGFGLDRAVTLEALAAENPIPLLGVVAPAAGAAARATRNGRIGLIGTQASIRSGAYERYIAAENPQATVLARACPLFVPLVENGRFHPGDVVIETVCAEYLAPMKEAGIDTLVLGCTHYPLLETVIGAYMGPGVKLVDAGAEGARAVGERLEAENALSGRDAGGVCRYFVSDRVEDFSRLASIFLRRDVGEDVTQIDINQY